MMNGLERNRHFESDGYGHIECHSRQEASEH